MTAEKSNRVRRKSNRSEIKQWPSRIVGAGHAIDGGRHERLEPQAHGGARMRFKSKPVPMADRDMLGLLQDIACARVDATGLQVWAAIAVV